MMKRSLSLLAAASLALAAALSTGAAHAVEAGQPAPDIELQYGGGTQKLSDMKGKVVYLDFWASWCVPCRQSFPWMNEMQRKYGPQGLQVVGVNLDAKRADADQFLAQVPAQFAVAFDAKGDSAKRAGVKGMPTSLLIDAQGKVVMVHQGFREDERAELEAKLAAAVAAKNK